MTCGTIKGVSPRGRLPFLLSFHGGNMTEENVSANVEAVLNPETFDVLDYLTNGAVAEDTIGVYTDLASARRLDELVGEREIAIAEKRAAERQLLEVGKADTLGITELDDEDEDTVYDDEINALVAELEKTKLVFHMRSVAPSLVRAINKSYDAKKEKGLSAEDEALYEDKRTADILSRAITAVELGDGTLDSAKWDAARLQKLEEVFYKEQSARLFNALFDMVYAGSYFDKAITADFS